MEGALNNILHGNCLDILKTIPDDSIDLVCTDPPYGYSFMGKDWDRVVMGVEYWAECVRVLKPGALAFVMSAPRQDVLSRAILNLQHAGFETGFTSIYWTYASGFPKAMNIGKMVDRRTGAKRQVLMERNVPDITGGNYGQGRRSYKSKVAQITVGSSALEGSYGGFQPKPAVEVIIIAMKPLAEKTYVAQALKNGKGITWLDDGRIPTSEPISVHHAPTGTFAGGEHWRGSIKNYRKNTQGRFPANLLVSDDVLNVESRGALAPVKSGQKGFGGEIYGKYRTGGDDGKSFHSDGETSGSFSRYFDLDRWAERTLPFLIVPKASKAEKNRGLEGRGAKAIKGRDEGQDIRNVPHKARSTPRINQHPTVKPVKLMSYLITLGSRPGEIVLDPFAGSGTTCIAALALGRKYSGIESGKEYVAIAEARLRGRQMTPNHR